MNWFCPQAQPHWYISDVITGLLHPSSGCVASSVPGHRVGNSSTPSTELTGQPLWKDPLTGQHTGLSRKALVATAAGGLPGANQTRTLSACCPRAAQQPLCGPRVPFPGTLTRLCRICVDCQAQKESPQEESPLVDNQSIKANTVGRSLTAHRLLGTSWAY